MILPFTTDDPKIEYVFKPRQLIVKKKTIYYPRATITFRISREMDSRVGVKRRISFLRLTIFRIQERTTLATVGRIR